MTADRYVPSREDHFSFGIWTVGWQGVDVFGGAVRPPMPADRAVRKLAELGAYGVNFHDNDVFDFDASPAEREQRIAAFRKALEETGLVVTTATTNLFGHPMFKDGAFTANEREVRRFALAKVMRNLDLAAELGAQTYVFWGGREGRGVAAPPRTFGTRSTGTPKGLNLLSQYVLDQGYDIRFAIEPKPNEPRGDILLPTIGHALAFINTLEHPEIVGVNPEIGHEEMAGLNYAHSASLRRCGTASCSTSTSTGRTARGTTRICGSARGTRAARSGWSTRCWPAATPARCTSISSRRAPRTTTASGHRPPRACATT